jgi:hypothetical protein
MKLHVQNKEEAEGEKICFFSGSVSGHARTVPQWKDYRITSLRFAPILA